jgi:signal transduction histidine kinase
MTPLLDSVLGPLIFLACFIAVILAGACLLVMQERRRQQVTQVLRWSQEVFDGITDGITIIDRDYRVLMVNKAVCLWQNKPTEFFVGKPCYEVFQQLHEVCTGCPAKETFTTGQPTFRERVSTTLGGRKYYFHLTTFPLKDQFGTTVRVAEYVKDVSREMELRSELIQYERKSMIVKMSAQVAHEIRNPLGTLTLNVDLLEDEIDNYTGSDVTEARSLLKTIKSEVEALHRVLDDYLECGRFPTIRPERHYINAILREMFGMLEAELRQKRIVCTTSFESHLPAVDVDQDQIRRAFMNLILNATEAMDSGGTLQVTTRSTEEWVEIIFEDSGVGMTQDQIEKIFTPFYSTKSGGTGLGLSITQHIITEHKGAIVCDSTVGQGARFTIRLPRSAHPA